MATKSNNKLVLFDIDHTLLDTDLLRHLSFAQIGKRLHQPDLEAFMLLANDEYQKMRSQGTFHPKAFIKQINYLLGIKEDTHHLDETFFDEAIIDQALYSDVLSSLEALRSDKTIKLGILSFGADNLQRKKIYSIIHMLESDYIYINEVDKIQNIPNIVQKHKTEQLYIVDDLPEVLERFKSLDSSVITILIQRDLNTPEKEPIIDFVADFTIQNLSKLSSIIK